jgi:hypothetical protein
MTSGLRLITSAELTTLSFALRRSRSVSFRQACVTPFSSPCYVQSAAEDG